MKFKTYPKIKQLGDKENEDIFADPDDIIVVQEKVDGANFRFMRHKDKLIFGSRTQQITSDEGEDTNVQKNFKNCVTYIRDLFENNLPLFNEGYIFFGECMTSHSLSYDWENIPRFLGFDIYELEINKFMPQPENVFTLIGLESVPVIWEGKCLNLPKIDDDFVPVSRYAPKDKPNQKAEGVVIKNITKGIYAKYVRKAFKEVNVKTFGGSKKWCTEDSDKIVAQYCTNPRIDKMIFKLIDDGEELSLKLMHKLPHAVMKDIYDEHSDDILYSRMKVDFLRVKNGVSTRCLHVLKQVMVNNSLK